MKVSEVMTRNVQACLPTEPLGRVAQIMWEQDCGCVPVISAEGKPVAMITDRDVCMAAYSRGARLDELPVERSMSAGVHTCKLDDPLDVPQATMRKYRVRRLPVVDKDGKLKGLLSLADVFRAAAKETSATKRRKWADDLMTTTSEIMQSHCELPAKPTPSALQSTRRSAESTAG